ncbi:MAG: CoA transferase [Variovorax sp.]|nr:MAG: CoA transferase [Variovorax sp.]
MNDDRRPTQALPTGAESSLHGVRVIDMSRVLAGPWAAQLLADLGADVIKLEHPLRGDDSRSWEPSFQSSKRPDLRQSAYFCAANRGKRSVTVDFGTTKGCDIVRQLARRSDVLIENYKVGTLARHGLSYAALAAENPGLIYCSITGFGQTGPYNNRPGYDTIIQAMGGLMSLTGQPDSSPGGEPLRAGLPVIDLMTGIHAALAITAALRHRERTGEGQHIDIGLLDVHVSALSYFGMNYLASGVLPQRTGNSNPVTFPSGTFLARDRRVVILVGNDGQFRRFCEVVGSPSLSDDPRFCTSPNRVLHESSLRSLIEPLLVARNAEHWIEALEDVGVPCAPINDLQAVFADPQVRAREGVRTLTHPVLGDMPILANPVRMSATPMRHITAPPTLGQDTDDVLCELLGMSADDISGLRSDGTI